MSLSNSGAMLRDKIERLVEIENEKKSLKEDRKCFVKELREQYGMPVTQLLLVRKQKDKDPKEEEAAREAMKTAGAVLGIPVYVAAADLTGFDHGFDQSVVEHAQYRVTEIRSLDQQVIDLGEEANEIYKEVKGAGFIPRVVKLIVGFKLDPDKRSDYDETSTLVTAYETAIGD